MKPQTIFTFLILLTISSNAHEKDVSVGISFLRSAFEKKAAKATENIEILNRSYATGLERLFDKRMEVGALTAAVLFKAEMKRFGDGKKLNPGAFQKKLSENNGLKRHQVAYLQLRKAFQSENRVQLTKLAVRYDSQLDELERYLAREKRKEDVTTVKKERRRLRNSKIIRENGIKFAAKRFKAKAHFIAKGEIDIFVNGKKLKYRNDERGDNREVTEVTSSPLTIGSGDTVVVKMKGDKVYRGVAFGFVSVDKSKTIPFPASAYRLIGKAAGIDPKLIGAGEILAKSKNTASKTRPDSKMLPAWKKHGLPGSGFIKPDEKGQWYVWGVVITPEMILTKK